MSRRIAAAAAGVAGLAYYTAFAPSSQVFGEVPFRGANGKPEIALTFDDGPNEPYTSDLVDLLDEARVRATFFQVGKCVERSGALPSQMLERGHLIGNHSYSHQFHRYLKEPNLGHEIARTQAILEAAIGRVPALMRTPWLFRHPGLLSEASRQGLQMVSGTFAHPLEVLQLPAWRIARRAVRLARPGSIVIFHDGFDARGGYRGRTVDAVRMVIAELTEQGLGFTTVDRLLGVAGYQTGPVATAQERRELTKLA